MSEFSGEDFDFAPGSMKGLRAWNMDKLGRLHGVTHEEVWLPGENVSVCKKEGRVPCPQINRRIEARRASEAGRAQVESKKKRRKRGHDDFLSASLSVGIDWSPRMPCNDPTCLYGEYHVVTSGHRFDPNCDCGFWAYDEAGFASHGSVVGVIEGYGKTTVGTKGFRSEKARIVALSCENGEGKRHSRSVLARLAALYPDVTFAENLDALIDGHSEVLRQWPEIDGEFWVKPVEPSRALSYYSLPSSAFRIGGGI
jgi:hypothetical protein